MKTCVGCEYHERAAMPVGQRPDGSLIHSMVATCVHSDLQDPVEGTRLPCQTLRSNEAFCGILGKKWKKKQEAEKPTSNIIEIS